MNNNEWSLWLRKNTTNEYDLLLFEQLGDGSEVLRYTWHFSNAHEALSKAEAIQEENGDGRLTGLHLDGFAARPISKVQVYDDAVVSGTKNNEIETPYKWTPILICPECDEMSRSSFWIDSDIFTTRFACESCGFEAFEGDEKFPSEKDHRVYQINGLDRALSILNDFVYHESHGDILIHEPVGEIMKILADIVHNATDGVV